MQVGYSRTLTKYLLLFTLVSIPLLTGLSTGTVAPHFSAKNQYGQVIQLAQFKGNYVLLYFYPKDDTPGCTKEAQTFRDRFSEFKKLNTVVLGVSTQDEESHKNFKIKHELPFDLLVDSDGALAKSFDVKTMPLLGFAQRQSVLISPDGMVVRFYRDVDPATHANEVLEDIKASIEKTKVIQKPKNPPSNKTNQK